MPKHAAVAPIIIPAPDPKVIPNKADLSLNILYITVVRNQVIRISEYNGFYVHFFECVRRYTFDPGPKMGERYSLKVDMLTW